jgi:inhibitor of KinA
MVVYHPYTIFPLGDSALTIEFGNCLDEQLNDKVLSLFQMIRSSNLPFITDLIPAYSSLTVYYDIMKIWPSKPKDKTVFELMAEAIEHLTATAHSIAPTSGELVEIPVCYEASYGPDLEMLAKEKNLEKEEVISLHQSRVYRVYMIGFLPGFAYMAEVDERISMPRKPQPRKAVAPGSVGIAGKQTGIYPLECPGGWQLIGQTPLKLFDKDRSQPVLLQAGTRVRFHSISSDEFKNYQGGRI